MRVTLTSLALSSTMYITRQSPIRTRHWSLIALSTSCSRRAVDRVEAIRSFAPRVPRLYRAAIRVPCALRVSARRHNYSRSRPRFTRSAFTFSSGIPASLRRDSEMRPSQKSSSRAPCFFRSMRTATLRPLPSVTNWTPVMGSFSHRGHIGVLHLFGNQLQKRSS
jgi:hypothetical protein